MTDRRCPNCSSTNYRFRGRKKVDPDPEKGTQQQPKHATAVMTAGTSGKSVWRPDREIGAACLDGQLGKVYFGAGVAPAQL
jgi:hypothetical protein